MPAGLMIRNANESDIPRIFEIRGAVHENKLRNPSRVTIEDLRWFIANPGIFVWDQDGRVAGFSIADPRNGSICALFIDPVYERRGYGRRLFERACAVLKTAGCERIWLTTSPGTRAEKFYLKAGWKVTGVEGDQLVFEAQSDV
jgi:GNAT superfamily N-acetyltransferase